VDSILRIVAVMSAYIRWWRDVAGRGVGDVAVVVGPAVGAASPLLLLAV
jgi:hypothetical protein